MGGSVWGDGEREEIFDKKERKISGGCPPKEGMPEFDHLTAG
jgi:hypothetical protein